MNSAKKPHRRKDERPGEIVKAAMEVFAETGFSNAKIVEIAKRAGAAKGTVYLYFENKDKLFEAVVREFISPVFAKFEAMSAAFPGSTSELLTLVIQRFYAELASHPERRAIMRILISEGERFPQLTEFYYKEVLASAQRIIGSIIQRGVDAGEFREPLALQHPGVIMGPAILAAVWKMTFDSTASLDLDAFAKSHVDLVLNGLCKRE